MGDDTNVDGRRARRERSRQSVIDAVVELVQAGKGLPTAETIAERAGVSVASIFRYFDGIADLQLQTYEYFRRRFAPLVIVSDDAATGTRPERIAALVESRLDLYEQAGAMMILGRLRSLEHEPLVAASANTRSLLADQVRALLALDLGDATPARSADLVAVVDAFTALESWDVMRRTHGRTRRQISQAWQAGIDLLVGDWLTQRHLDATTASSASQRTSGSGAATGAPEP